MSNTQSPTNVTELDPDFGPDKTGITHPDFKDGYGSVFNGGTVAPDGKIIIAGQRYSPVSSYLIAQLTPDGLEDRDFALNGCLSGEFEQNGNVSKGVGVTLLSDNRILLCGLYQKTAGDRYYCALALSDSSGTLVPSFGTNGSIVIRPPGWETPHSSEGGTPAIGEAGSGSGSDIKVIELPNGKLLVALSHQIDFANSTAYLVRLNVNGEIDTSFGDDGYVNIGHGSDYTVNLSMVQLGQHLYTAGAVYRGVTWTPRVAKYDLEGQPDKSFGVNGSVLLESDTSAQLFSITPLENDTLLVSGGDKTGFLACIDSSGKYSKTFNRGLPLRTSLPQTPEGLQWKSAIETADHKILALTSTIKQENAEIHIARFMDDGRLDTAFADNGVLNVKTSDVTDVCSTMVKQGGKLIVLGYSGLFSNGFGGFVFRLK